MLWEILVLIFLYFGVFFFYFFECRGVSSFNAFIHDYESDIDMDYESEYESGLDDDSLPPSSPCSTTSYLSRTSSYGRHRRHTALWKKLLRTLFWPLYLILRYGLRSLFLSFQCSKYRILCFSRCLCRTKKLSYQDYCVHLRRFHHVIAATYWHWNFYLSFTRVICKPVLFTPQSGWETQAPRWMHLK